MPSVTSRPALALITGATGGIGSAFARALADRGYQLVLTDRDADALATLCAQMPGTPRTVVADLSVRADVALVAEHLADVDLLVNNAGFGTFSMYAESDLERELDMVRVHVEATMSLTRAALPGMIARGGGAVINVASAGAFQRFPRDATYIGTKAFLVAFTECLAIELVGTGVRVQALCPAWVRTPFTAAGDYAKVGYRSPIPAFMFTSPETVVASSLEALRRGQVTHIPTLRARLGAPALGSRPAKALLAAMRRRRPA